MNTDEARRLLIGVMREFGQRSYKELVAGVDLGPVARQLDGPSGVEYTIEIEVLWDDHPGGDVRVTGAIDDGRFFAALVPLCDDFIMTPDGRVIGSI